MNQSVVLGGSCFYKKNKASINKKNKNIFKYKGLSLIMRGYLECVFSSGRFSTAKVARCRKWGWLRADQFCKYLCFQGIARRDAMGFYEVVLPFSSPSIFKTSVVNIKNIRKFELDSVSRDFDVDCFFKCYQDNKGLK
jgi:hypothetical protein